MQIETILNIRNKKKRRHSTVCSWQVRSRPVHEKRIVYPCVQRTSYNTDYRRHAWFLLLCRLL